MPLGRNEADGRVDDLLVYGGLFVAAFVAATILPAQSEAALIGLQVSGYPVFTLVLVASIGNTLGAVMNWVLGRSVERYHDRRWFPVSPAVLTRASRWYARWGRWSLLLSWAPIAGDALTVAAGILREPFKSFIILVAIAKTGRYLVLADITARLTP